MNIKNMPFEATNSGKCNDCEEKKPLDMMLRKTHEKGIYHCIDCKVEEENTPLSNQNYDFLGESNTSIEKSIKQKITEKLMIWCFG